ncbi:MAG: Alpha/beta hydrolase family protein [Myxococcaceae bacterium]|nr:Alpha/beta hydrolase family protein [Myxococcaceae bacterium]
MRTAPTAFLAALSIVLSSLLGACGSGGNDDATPADAGVFEPPVNLRDGASWPGDGGSSSADATTQRAVPDVSARDGGPAPVFVRRPAETVSLGWKTCADTLQCGTLHVPIDYEHPESGTLKLAVMRRLATGVRTGALLLNPGGPGSSAVDYLGYFVQGSTSPLLERFDLVAFDPRGVSYSTPLECHSKLQQLVAADPTPDSEAEGQALDDLSAAFAAECAQAENAYLLPFLGTANVARDMERVRAALGEDKLHYLGFSYGTSIGAWYAELFPSRVGRFVLDSAVDLGLDAFELALGQARGFELALSHYFQWCKDVPSRCSWTGGVEPLQAFTALQAAVETQPIPAPMSDRALGIGELMQAVAATMYGGTEGWRALSPALSAALAGDASTLMSFVDGYLGRNMDGSYPNLQEINSAVSCTDTYAPTVAEVRAAAARFASEAPLFGVRALTSLLVCSHWPVPGHTVAAPRGQGAPPLLVLGNTNDPATPFAWTQAFALDLVSSVLLTTSIEGHTAYSRGDPCIDNAVNAFLFDALLPTAPCALSAPKSRAGESPSLPSSWLRRRH